VTVSTGAAHEIEGTTVTYALAMAALTLFAAGSAEAAGRLAGTG
jgi:hypothetical protein